MADVILLTGYETQVQVAMGVTETILPIAAIQSKAKLAEALSAKIVPNHAAITGHESTFLQSACVAQVCALLYPDMHNRIKVAEIRETGDLFRPNDVDGFEKKAEFEGLINDLVNLATGGEVVHFSPLGVVVNMGRVMLC